MNHVDFWAIIGQQYTSEEKAYWKLQTAILKVPGYKDPPAIEFITKT